MAQRKKDALPKTKTAEEWAAFFRCIATRYPTAARNHALLYLTYLTGMRIGEALLLEVRDVDLDRFKVRVRQGKTGERVVPLADDSRLHTSLERWIRVREEWSPTSDLLFVTRSGECLSDAAVRRSAVPFKTSRGIVMRSACAQIVALAAAIPATSRAGPGSSDARGSWRIESAFVGSRENSARFRRISRWHGLNHPVGSRGCLQQSVQPGHSSLAAPSPQNFTCIKAF